MKKSADAFRSIGEVSQLIGVAPHVLRYWEAQFPLFAPVKRRDGRRYYRPDDVRLAAGLCEVLREDGMTIRGAKKAMAADKGASLRARGAARLEGIAPQLGPGEETPEVEQAEATERQAKPRARKAKAVPETNGTLPLFPELLASEGEPVQTGPAPSGNAPAPKRAARAAPSGDASTPKRAAKAEPAEPNCAEPIAAKTAVSAAIERPAEPAHREPAPSGSTNPAAAHSATANRDAPRRTAASPAEWAARLTALALGIPALPGSAAPGAARLLGDLQRARAQLAAR
ncbi:MAG: MerR family transcriptional regulator [Paracoccus sp. (in: a-proteobacteria)]|nr:MerR family transcriptional regulator [Paracoccus sp. (in: a-proteobacteria)]